MRTLLTLKRHLPSCLVLIRQKSHLGKRWRGCTWSGNQAFPCSLLPLSTLGAHIMQPSTLSCPKREAINAFWCQWPHETQCTIFTMDGGKQDSGLRAQFLGDKTRRICHQLMYQGCVCGGTPLHLHQAQRKDVPCRAIWQPGRMATNHKAEELIYCLNS